MTGEGQNLSGANRFTYVPSTLSQIALIIDGDAIAAIAKAILNSRRSPGDCVLEWLTDRVLVLNAVAIGTFLA